MKPGRCCQEQKTVGPAELYHESGRGQKKALKTRYTWNASTINPASLRAEVPDKLEHGHGLIHLDPPAGIEGIAELVQDEIEVCTWLGDPGNPKIEQDFVLVAALQEQA